MRDISGFRLGDWSGLAHETAKSGLTHGGAVHVFAGIHKCQQSTENSCLKLV